MIKLPEREDDIYVNALICAYVSRRDQEQAFDLDANRAINRIVRHEVESRLDECFLDNSSKRWADSEADECFYQGWVQERGMDGLVDCQAAAVLYRQAAELGHLEAQFRLAWLIENGLAGGYGDTGRLYQEAADHGHVKALIACGQCRLFQAANKCDLQASKGYFEKANLIEPFLDYLYIGAIDEMLSESTASSGFDVADHVEHVLPLIGHLKQGESVHYQRGIESNIRLAKFLHQHHRRTGTFFLSWCYMNGVGVPAYCKLGMQLAYQVYSRHNAISNYYMAWLHLHSGDTRHARVAIQFLQAAIAGGCEIAERDMDIIKEAMLIPKQTPTQLTAANSSALFMEKWFSLR